MKYNSLFIHWDAIFTHTITPSDSINFVGISTDSIFLHCSHSHCGCHLPCLLGPRLAGLPGHCLLVGPTPSPVDSRKTVYTLKVIKLSCYL